MHEIVVELSRRFFEQRDAQHKEIMSALHRVEKQQEKIMSKITDAAAASQASFDKISADLDSLSADIKTLNDQIAALQNSTGTLTPEDQAALDAIQKSAADLATKADGIVPPPATPPAATPPAA